MAWFGGFRYSPTTSRSFSTKNASIESLKLLVRCGCRPKRLKKRCTALFDSPAPHAPVRTGPRFGIQRAATQLGNPLIVNRTRPTRTQRIVQSRDPSRDKPAAPCVDRGRVQTQLARDLPIARPAGAGQHHLPVAIGRLLE